MRNIKAEAEKLRIELVGHWITIPEVVAWADEILISEADPPPQVIDLSLSMRMPLDNIMRFLANIPGTIDQVTIMRECLADMRHWMGEDIERAQQIAQGLYTLVNTGLLPEAEFGREPYYLDDFFYLARSGVYGTLVDAMKYLQGWLDTNARRDEEI